MATAFAAHSALPPPTARTASAPTSSARARGGLRLGEVGIDADERGHPQVDPGDGREHRIEQPGVGEAPIGDDGDSPGVQRAELVAEPALDAPQAGHETRASTELEVGHADQANGYARWSATSR